MGLMCAIASNLNEYLKTWLLWSIFLGVFCFGTFGQSNGGAWRVASIETPGLVDSERKMILEALHLAEGEDFDSVATDEAIRTLVSSGIVQSLVIRLRNSPQGAELVVDVGFKKRIGKLDTSGIKPYILSEVKSSLEGIKSGNVLEPRALAEVKQAIKAAYESRGYFFVEVEAQVQKILESDKVDLKITVTEGIPTKVSRLKVSNVDKESSAEFRRVIKLKIGTPFTRAALEDSINSLREYFRENQYPEGRVEETNLNFSEDKTRVEVDFVLRTGQKYQFMFSGNNVFGDEVIRSWITADVLATSDPIRAIEGVIETKYKEIGYHFCKVQTVYPKIREAKIKRYHFNIDEGEKVIVDSVTVSGASEYGGNKFKDLFYQSAEGVLARGVFWESGLEPTCRKMIQELENQGYLRVSLPVPRVSYSDDKKGAELFFNVELGNQIKVSRIDILGVTEERRKILENMLLFKVGQPVSRLHIGQSKIEIEKYYLREGYVDVKMGGGEDVIFAEDPSKAIVKLSVEEGKQYFVGSISVEGNRHTKGKVIERELRVKSGEKFNVEKIRQSEDELLLTGLFSKAEMIGTVDEKEPSKKNVKVAVLETMAGSGELGMGAVYEDPRFRLRSFVGLAYNNVFGVNQTASVRTELGLPLSQKFERLPFVEYSAILSYRAPYLFDIPAVFFSQASLDNYEVGTSSGGKLSNLQTRARIEERIEKKLSNTVSFIYRFHRFERATTKTLVLFDSNDPNNPTNPNGNNFQPGFPSATEVVDIGSTGPGLQMDLRDDPFNPSSGSFHTLDGEIAHPSLLASNQVRFYMLTARNSFFLPLFNPLGLALFAGAGYADSLDHQYQIPKARLLTDLSLGGQGSVRGFSPRIFNPQAESVTAGFYNLRAELRSSIIGDLSAAVFMDSGQIFSKTAGKSWVTGLRHDGVGVGLRYKTPVGPAVIDVSQGLGPDKETMKFNFTIGVF